MDTVNTITLKDIAEQRKKMISEWPAEKPEVLERIRLYSSFTEQYIRENADSLDWRSISKYVSVEILTRLVLDYPDDIVWAPISIRILPDNFKSKFSDKLAKPESFEAWLKCL